MKNNGMAPHIRRVKYGIKKAPATWNCIASWKLKEGWVGLEFGVEKRIGMALHIRRVKYGIKKAPETYVYSRYTFP